MHWLAAYLYFTTRLARTDAALAERVLTNDSCSDAECARRCSLCKDIQCGFIMYTHNGAEVLRIRAIVHPVFPRHDYEQPRICAW